MSGPLDRFARPCEFLSNCFGSFPSFELVGSVFFAIWEGGGGCSHILKIGWVWCSCLLFNWGFKAELIEEDNYFWRHSCIKHTYTVGSVLFCVISLRGSVLEVRQH